MSLKILPKPTEAELQLLRVLWELGPSTVREIHEAGGDEKETGYTTTLKILQKMAEKGLVERDESARSHIYHTAIKAEQTQRQLVRDLLQKAFGGTDARVTRNDQHRGPGKRDVYAHHRHAKRVREVIRIEPRPTARWSCEPCGQVGLDTSKTKDADHGLSEAELPRAPARTKVAW